jgi:hypothetical protein
MLVLVVHEFNKPAGVRQLFEDVYVLTNKVRHVLTPKKKSHDSWLFCAYNAIQVVG